MNRFILTGGCSAAPPPACGRETRGEEAATSADELVMAKNVELSPRSTVDVAVISRFFPASPAQLGSGTQQFKVLAIWLTSAWSTAESRGQYT